MRIRRIGEFLPLDEHGYIVRQASVSLIGRPWSKAIEDIRLAFVGHLAPHLHSVYVRGSVATGSAVPKISDIDTFAVVDSKLSEVDLAWRQAYLDAACQRFPFATSIEANVFSLQKFLENEQYARARFLLKVNGICVYGTDLSVAIKRYRPDRGVVFYAPELAHRIGKAREALAAGYDPGEVGRWIMKAIVRAGFELVMEREGRYARDLYPCYETFCRYYCDKRAGMRMALELVLKPARDAGQVVELLDGFGDWLVRETERYLQ